MSQKFKKRTKGKYTTDIRVKEIYNYYSLFYFKEYPTTKEGVVSKIPKIHRKGKYYVSLTLFSKILKDFYKGISEEILKGYYFPLFSRMGNISIRKMKLTFKVDDTGELITNAPIDWKSTLDLWQEDEDAKNQKILVRHINTHSNGYIYRWFYDRGLANFRNKTKYAFIPSRENQRNLAKLIKDENNEIDFYNRPRKKYD